MFSLIKKLDHQFFFPYLPPQESEKYFLKKEVRKYPLDELSLRNTPEDLKAYFIACTLNWGLEEFHFCYTDGCVIEPSAGWGITKNNKVIPQSIWNYYIHKVNKPYFLRYMLAPVNKIYLKSAVSLQYAWMNYWHFYNDILGQLCLADEVGLPYDIPIIVPAGIQNMNYFKEFLSLSGNLKNRNWVFQDKRTQVFCEEAHFFNTFWDHRKNFDNALNTIKFEDKIRISTEEQNRIFITRKKNRGRNIENIEDVHRLLSRYNFEFIDCEDLSILQQADVFQRAGYVIGIHGAGLTNIIYRQGKPMKLLEIFSSSYFNPCYYWLCQQYQYDYYGLIGSISKDSGKTTGSFSIDIKTLEIQLIAMLDK